MKIKPKEVFVNLPIVLLFNTEEEVPQLASSFNTFLHGKVRLKCELLGQMSGQFVGLFYLQRNKEFSQLRDEFVQLIEQETIAEAAKTRPWLDVSEPEDEDVDTDPEPMAYPEDITPEDEIEAIEKRLLQSRRRAERDD